MVLRKSSSCTIIEMKNGGNGGWVHHKISSRIHEINFLYYNFVVYPLKYDANQ